MAAEAGEPAARPAGAPAGAEVGLGVASAAAAYLIWGIAPLYFKLVGAVPATEVLAHRIVWSLLLLTLMLPLARRRFAGIRAALSSPRQIATSLVTTVLVAGNWLIYIWAIAQGRVLEASLGYYILPLLMIALGVLVLGERLSRLRMAALALGCLAVANELIAVGSLPWVSLALAATFGLYGLLRKTMTTGALDGLWLETAISLPAALAYLAWLDGGVFFAGDAGLAWFLAAAGPVTAVPLLLFAVGARRLDYSTIGWLQYIAPTLQFLLAVLLFGEPFGPSRLVTFVLIWLALSLVVWELLKAERRRLRTRPRRS